MEFLYLTTTGRITGRSREIEIWFITLQGKYYVLAERFHEARWVKNVEHSSRVRVRVAGRSFEATARVLDPQRDSQTWQQAQELAREKYGWGEGLPVELTPV